MATSYRVVPNDGGWKVMAAKGSRKNHSTVSTHRKKSAAKRRARQLADGGDRLVILRADGSIQTNNKVRG
jgi:hypothetical protein